MTLFIIKNCSCFLWSISKNANVLWFTLFEAARWQKCNKIEWKFGNYLRSYSCHWFNPPNASHSDVLYDAGDASSKCSCDEKNGLHILLFCTMLGILVLTKKKNGKIQYLQALFHIVPHVSVQVTWNLNVKSLRSRWKFQHVIKCFIWASFRAVLFRTKVSVQFIFNHHSAVHWGKQTSLGTFIRILSWARGTLSDLWFNARIL